MNKDSLDISEADHDIIARTAHDEAERCDGVVVVHGTDRLAKSGERVLALGTPKTPVVFTGAMRPFELRDTDALQNLADGVSVQLVPPGVYVAMHDQLLQFPGVVKDHTLGTFTKP